VLISLGQQLPLDFNVTCLDLTAVNFIKIITNRINTCFVRDFLTKKCLDYYKDKDTKSNIIVTGCPSIFCNLNLKQDYVLHKNIDKIRQADTINILYSVVTINDTLYNKTLDWIKKIFKDYKINIKLLLVDYYSYSKEKLEKYKDQMHYHSVKDAYDNFRPHISIDNRIHGSILAISHSIPTVMIYHDSRTQLLSQELKIPNISPDDLYKFENFFDLLKIMNYTEFNKNKLDKAKLYKEYFKQIGLPITNSFENMSFFEDDYKHHNYIYNKY
jgi:hypothetical protein